MVVVVVAIVGMFALVVVAVNDYQIIISDKRTTKQNKLN